MAAMYRVIYWRDIPAQVKVKEGRKRIGKPLSNRFPVAIDEAAMRAGLTGSDDYLAQWRNGEWTEREGEAEELLDEVLSELEEAYPPKRLRTLIDKQGLDNTGDV